MGGMIDAITAPQKAVLRALVPVLPDHAYLAGGVAVAATLRHRTSFDLDLFVPEDFDPERVAERMTAEIAGLRITSTAPGTLYLEVDGVPVSVIAYRYPLLAEPLPSAELGVRVASLEDLTCMKLSAIASRGMTRDFWDLHALLAHGAADGSLRRALQLYQGKFSADDIGHVIRSLVYFGDADDGPLPRDLSEAEWARIKLDFESWVVDLGFAK
jgi:hypothetical protein